MTATAPATVPLPVVSTAPQATPAQPTSAARPPQALKAQPQPPQAVVSSAKATAAVISDVNAVEPQEQAKRYLLAIKLVFYRYNSQNGTFMTLCECIALSHSLSQTETACQARTEVEAGGARDQVFFGSSVV